MGLNMVIRCEHCGKTYYRGEGKRGSLCSLACRFEAKIDRSGGVDACHNWLASTGTTGYGAIKRDGSRVPEGAHRIAWEMANGKPPVGMCVLHKCDNRRCCNTRHLSLGTDQDNSTDKCAKGRQSRGEDHYNAKLSKADVLTIRARVAAGEAVASVARDYGVRWSAIHKIRSGVTWKCVEPMSEGRAS